MTEPLLAVEVLDARGLSILVLRSLRLVILDLFTSPLAVRLGPESITSGDG